MHLLLMTNLPDQAVTLFKVWSKGASIEGSMTANKNRARLLLPHGSRFQIVHVHFLTELMLQLVKGISDIELPLQPHYAIGQLVSVSLQHHKLIDLVHARSKTSMEIQVQIITTWGLLL